MIKIKMEIMEKVTRYDTYTWYVGIEENHPLYQKFLEKSVDEMTDKELEEIEEYFRGHPEEVFKGVCGDRVDEPFITKSLIHGISIEDADIIKDKR